MSFIQHTIEYISAFGPAYTLRRLGEKAGEAVFHRWDRAWRESYAPDEAELARQRASQPDCGLISVLIPVYRTEPALLEALLESLAAQTLANWEAVLALSGDRAETAETLDRWAERDARFRVIPLAENKGISGNTNAALAAARGEWAVLCDHDDTLPPDALWRIADRAARGGADVIYTDEDKLTPDGRRHTDPHFKPDFSPDNLRSGNYICHLLAARRSLVEAAGGLRPGFDGSQDHDLVLRLSERTGAIVHLPFIGYHWRTLNTSMSHQHLEKCLDAAARATAEHMARIGYPGRVTVENGLLRLHYALKPRTGAVWIMAAREEDGANCRRCLEGVLPEDVAVRIKTFGAEENRAAAMNEAAAASAEDLLLFVDASIPLFSGGLWQELAMYAQREDVGMVTPLLMDMRNRVTHAGFAVGGPRGAVCRNLGLPGRSAGWHLLNRQSHNVGAVSPACLMVRRAAWEPLDTDLPCAAAVVAACVRMAERGLRHVYTPYAAALCERADLLLTGAPLPEEALSRLRERLSDWADPCWNPNFRLDKADFSFRRSKP